jgi:amidase
LPVGVSFIGTAFSEPTLIRLAAGFEHAAHARIVPQFFETLPQTNIHGPALPLKGGHVHLHHL